MASQSVRTSFAPGSGRERTFSFENLHRFVQRSLENLWKTSGKPAEKGCFLPYKISNLKKKKFFSCSVTEFCARNRACRHIPQASNNPDDTRFEAQSPYMTTGIALHCYDSKFDSLHCHNITFWVTVLISWRQLIDTIHFDIYI